MLKKPSARDVEITNVTTHGTAYVISGTVDGKETMARISKRELDAIPTPAGQRRKLAERLAQTVPEEHYHLRGSVTV